MQTARGSCFLLAVMWLLPASTRAFAASSITTTTTSSRHIMMTAFNKNTKESLFDDLEWNFKHAEKTVGWERFQCHAHTMLSALIFFSFNRDTTTMAVAPPRHPTTGYVILEGSLPNKKSVIVRIGLTTRVGPPLPPLAATTRELLQSDDSNISTTNRDCMALIFVWIDPDYRGQQWGVQAVSLVRYLHGIWGAASTVLVAADSGSGRLVPWYEQQGFVQATELQDYMGSPNCIHGTVMMGRTLQEPPSGFWKSIIHYEWIWRRISGSKKNHSTKYEDSTTREKTTKQSLRLSP